uniref:Enhancer of polycomb-like protein n=1 Tax=Mesocestoides corti TaxID=53468 RepID=A0A5K3G2A5_MESCO
MYYLRGVLRYSLKAKEVGPQNTNDVAGEDLDHDLIAVNDSWNSQTKRERERYYTYHFNEKIMESLSRRKEYDQTDAICIEMLKKRLMSVKGNENLMVTRENLDAKLSEVMESSPIQFNRAISTRGTFIQTEQPVSESTSCETYK